jgi:hypothetical protein
MPKHHHKPVNQGEEMDKTSNETLFETLGRRRVLEAFEKGN